MVPKKFLIKLIRYSNSRFAGCKWNRKNTGETCQFLEENLISWFSKK